MARTFASNGSWIVRARSSSRAAGGDDRYALGRAPGDHCRFGAGVIDGIQDIIEVLAKHLGHIFRADEVFDFGDATCRIDVAYPFRHGACFRFAECVAERMNLAVDVGLGNHVKVDQGEGADA